MPQYNRFAQPKGKEGEEIKWKDVEDWDSHMWNSDFWWNKKFLDESKALAYGSFMGILLGDFLKIIENYCMENNRKFFMAYNNLGQPTIFFDCESKEELQSQWNKEKAQLRRKKKLKKSVANTREFMSPKKKQ